MTLEDSSPFCPKMNRNSWSVTLSLAYGLVVLIGTSDSIGFDGFNFKHFWHLDVIFLMSSDIPLQMYNWQALVVRHTANVYSQTAVEVHWKTCFLSESTVPWLQFFYKYFTVLVVNNNCYYCRYFNAFSNAAKWKCKVQLITAIWNTGKLTQIVQGKAVHFTFKNTLFLLRRETILLATIIGRIDNFMIVIWWQGEKFAAKVFWKDN